MTALGTGGAALGWTYQPQPPKRSGHSGGVPSGPPHLRGQQHRHQGTQPRQAPGQGSARRAPVPLQRSCSGTDRGGGGGQLWACGAGAMAMTLLTTSWGLMRTALHTALAWRRRMPGRTEGPWARESLEGEPPPPPLPTAPTLPQRHSHTPTPAPTIFPTASNRPPQPLAHPLQPLCNRSGTAPMAPLPFKQSPAVGCQGEPQKKKKKRNQRRRQWLRRNELAKPTGLKPHPFIVKAPPVLPPSFRWPWSKRSSSSCTGPPQLEVPGLNPRGARGDKHPDCTGTAGVQCTHRKHTHWHSVCIFLELDAQRPP